MKIPTYTKLVVSASAVVALSMVLLAAGPSAYALDVAGVNYQSSAQVGKRTLVLNGAGVRRLDASDIYTAGLYLEKRLSTPDTIFKSEGSKQLRVVFLRDINGRQLGDLLLKGLTTNANDEELAKLIPEIVRLGDLIAEQGKLRSGDGFVIDWIPADGTTISVQEKGRPKATVKTFKTPDLVNVMMRIWLGHKPADPALKNALLGQSN